MNYIDLFAGAGGLSEGFKKAGFTPLAHVEMDKNACDTLRTRTSYHYLKERGNLECYHEYLYRQISREQLFENVPHTLLDSVIESEISDDTIDGIFKKIDCCVEGKEIDLIVGGPPCQAYSSVGRSKINSIANRNVKDDDRYILYKQYGRFIQRYQPEYFVFENVLGILSAEGGDLIKQIARYFEVECGYKIQWQILHANHYGVLQLRKRVIIIGRKGLEPFDYPLPQTVTREREWTVKKALLSDLQYLHPGQERHISRYKTNKASDYLESSDMRSEAGFVTQHITRPHNERDIEIYKLAIEKWKKRERLKYTDVPKHLQTHKNLNAFLDRYKVVDPDGLSHTVVAHLSRDGHYYIYPDENQVRSLSVREAARIQSFPDDYYFEGGRSAAFKQIGNAVPPQLAFAIANKMKEVFVEEEATI
ncbi:DNA cytosine methyltransferase [Persicitalea sp.]|uniref:DNA cytosine methyltransferase n=1 Tax=Persicitalea sp. TaxID=3100273 RepID=UPI0035938462